MHYEALPGEHIGKTAETIATMATAHRCRVTSEFNGIPLVAYPGANPRDVEGAYWTESQRRREAYLASPEGQRALAQRDEADRRNRERAGELAPFPLHAVLTLATGRAWGDFSEAHRLAEWMQGGPVWTHEFAFCAAKFRALAIAALPGAESVAEADCPTFPDDVAEKLAAQVARFGETVNVPRGAGE